jgi:hypothetical protein
MDSVSVVTEGYVHMQTDGNMGKHT